MSVNVVFLGLISYMSFAVNSPGGGPLAQNPSFCSTAPSSAPLLPSVQTVVCSILPYIVPTFDGGDGNTFSVNSDGTILINNIPLSYCATALVIEIGKGAFVQSGTNAILTIFAEFTYQYGGDTTIIRRSVGIGNSVFIQIPTETDPNLPTTVLPDTISNELDIVDGGCSPIQLKLLAVLSTFGSGAVAKLDNLTVSIKQMIVDQQQFF